MEKKNKNLESVERLHISLFPHPLPYHLSNKKYYIFKVTDVYSLHFINMEMTSRQLSDLPKVS